ncbi:Choline/Carnitine o-acyltransferase-domain-containing protein [Hyaloraphidium curvatum]|nr:Choline/Carnitine o-acyltransferase-domain-containing protein [Hyaloraphidium curvatum]
MPSVGDSLSMTALAPPNSGRRRSSVKPHVPSPLSSQPPKNAPERLPRRPSTPADKAHPPPHQPHAHAPPPTTLIKSFPVPEPLHAKYAAELPFLPVPDLDGTLERYLASVRPFLNDLDWEVTTNAVREFAAPGGPGRLLQQRLVQRAKEAEALGQSGYLKELHRCADGIVQPTRASWVSDPPPVIVSWAAFSDGMICCPCDWLHRRPQLIDWWNEYSYCAFRDMTPINVNYFFVFPDDRRTGPEALRYMKGKGAEIQIKRGAAMIHAAMEFREQLRSGTLPADKMGKPAQQMDMNQYRYLFNACRIPAMPSDYVATYPGEENWHVTVMCMNKIWSFETKKDGKLMSVDEIELQVRRIVEDSPSTSAAPLGVLTAGDRDAWSASRPLLLSAHPSHPEILRVVESSAFMLCLDQTMPTTRAEVARACWHGDGQNRWFDKSFQLIAFANGKCGFNGEHSMMDATPTARLGDFICARLLSVRFGEPLALDDPSLPEPQPLEFHPPASLIPAIAASLDHFSRTVARHDLHVLRYTSYGKSLPKSAGMSPDSFVQMAFQLAYYRAHGQWVATYESAGMRRYLWGRTETCRSVSTESVDLVRGWHDPDVSASEKAVLLRAACKSQSKYMAECLAGHGVDRHLLGLRLSLAKDEHVPAIYADPAYAVSSHWTMSTSQIPSEYFDGYGWGEVVPDGFGLAYMVREHSIHVNVTGLIGAEGDTEADGSEMHPNRVSRMVHLLEEIFDEMRDVINEAKREEEEQKKAQEAASREIADLMAHREQLAAEPLRRPPSSSIEAINEARPRLDTFFSHDHTTAASQIISHAEREHGSGGALRARRVSVASLGTAGIPRPMSPLHPQPSQTPPPATIETAGTQGIGVDAVGLSLAYPSRHTLAEMVYNDEDGLLEGLGHVDLEDVMEAKMPQPQSTGRLGFLGRRLAAIWGWE